MNRRNVSHRSTPIFACIFNVNLAVAVSNELDNIKKELAEGQSSYAVSIRKKSDSVIFAVRIARDEAVKLATKREGELSNVKSAEPLMLQALAMFRSGTTFK